VGIGNAGMVATITGNTIMAADVAVWVVLGRANVDNNDAIAGFITVALGQMHLAGNNLAGASIVDSNLQGGLLNNPTRTTASIGRVLHVHRLGWERLLRLPTDQQRAGRRRQLPLSGHLAAGR